MKTLAFFNNKGGVGKTTLLYHLAWMLAEMGKRVLVADLDPQANLTSMFLTEPELEKLWDPDNAQDQSIMAPLTPIIRGLGDIGPTPFQHISSNIRLIPGDLNLSNFESNLSEAWGKCLDRQEPAFRVTSSLYRIIRQAADSFEADLVLVDVGPNFGAINRAALICADAVVIPLAPDLFSIQGLRNLGPTLTTWRKDWRIRLTQNPAPDLLLPEATMQPLGYVVIQFGIRDSKPVWAYEKWARKIPSTFREKVLSLPPNSITSTVDDPNCLGLLKHYRSLMPMAMEARKPIFKLKPSDGAIGAHSKSAKDSGEDFRDLAEQILNALDKRPE
ncbi:ParA family protein [Phragmitibacter flavus]|uniref:ParA family protein n=1 Tax=Phragmitibacter flavus TaxID=2576071 RepID=A0A5R8K8H1_9BACT|nr:ParA family protein [Phragmitibacter flavus]TLD68637.1 ParA family protein [Phragmitibacter flavus]